MSMIINPEATGPSWIRVPPKKKKPRRPRRRKAKADPKNLAGRPGSETSNHTALEETN